MEFIDQGDLLVVNDYSYLVGDDVFLGSIKTSSKDDGKFYFYPSRSLRKVGLTCRQLRDIAAKLSELN